MLRRHSSCHAALVAVLFACAVPSVAEEPIFVDRAAEVGLDFVHWNGMTGEYYFPEMTGPGCAFLDYDGDGDLDVYLVQGALLAGDTMDDALVPFPGDGPPRGRLFRNDSRAAGPGEDGALVPRFVDVTDASGLLATGYGMGAATGDYDGDGWTDLYLANYGPNQLWRNRGDGGFEDVTAEAGVGDPTWSTSASFFDADRDGRLDLYVVDYIAFDVADNPRCYTGGGRRDYCGPSDFRPVTDRLFRNRGPGPGGVTFEDVSGPSGIASAPGPGLGVVAADFDRDGWTDLFVANDGAVNFLWRNRGPGKGGRVHFTDEGLLAGVALNRSGQAEASMGVDAGDFDGDGDLDLFMTHLTGETNTLYVNDGSGLFEDRTLETGLGAPSFPLTSFGTAWLDYDNDGWLDLLTASGAVRVLEEQVRAGEVLPLEQPKQLFRNVLQESGGRRFEDVTEAGGEALTRPEVSRGLAVGDVDADGDPDVLLANNNGPARLLVDGVGQAAPWVAFEVVGERGPAAAPAIGAEVALRRAGGSEGVGPPRLQLGRVRTDGSYASANAPRVLFGLGDGAPIEEVRVRRPDGGETSWRGIEPGRTWVLYASEEER